MVRKVLLFCGILAPLLRVAADVLAAVWYPGYSYIDQTMSQLAAIGAPTRPFQVALLALPAHRLAGTLAGGSSCFFSITPNVPLQARRSRRVACKPLLGGTRLQRAPSGNPANCQEWTSVRVLRSPLSNGVCWRLPAPLDSRH